MSEAFTITGNGILKELRTPCKVSPVSLDKDFDFDGAAAVSDAIWDTGAQITVISNKIVEVLHLFPTGMGRNITAAGIIEVKRYMVDIMLPNGVVVKSLTVISSPLEDTDILIGMDIISLCDFRVCNVNGCTKFSFQIPGSHDIDFNNV